MVLWIPKWTNLCEVLYKVFNWWSVWLKSRILFYYQLSYPPFHWLPYLNKKPHCKIKKHCALCPNCPTNLCSYCISWRQVSSVVTSNFGDGCHVVILQTHLVSDSHMKVLVSYSEPDYWFTTTPSLLSRNDCHRLAIHSWLCISVVSGNLKVYCCLYLPGGNCDRLWDW